MAKWFWTWFAGIRKRITIKIDVCSKNDEEKDIQNYKHYLLLWGAPQEKNRKK